MLSREEKKTENDELKQQWADSAEIKKMQVLAYERIMHAKRHHSAKQVARVHDCRHMIVLAADSKGKHRTVLRTDSCSWRYCPICEAQRAAERATKFGGIMQAATVIDGVQWIFATLTVPNVSGHRLAGAIKGLQEAWRRISRRTDLKRLFGTGTIKKLEVTYNHQLRSFHPHLHILCAVKPSYFRDVVNREELLAAWQDATGNRKITQVNISAANDPETAADELGKYVAKAEDYLASQAVFDVFDEALHGVRMFSLSGICKQYGNAYEVDKELSTGAFRQFLTGDRSSVDDVAWCRKQVGGYNFAAGAYYVSESKLSQDEIDELRARHEDQTGWKKLCKVYDRTKADNAKREAVYAAAKEELARAKRDDVGTEWEWRYALALRLAKQAYEALRRGRLLQAGITTLRTKMRLRVAIQHNRPSQKENGAVASFEWQNYVDADGQERRGLFAAR